MGPVRLQHLQWLGGLAVAACCLALGGATLFASLDDYRRYKLGTEELDRFHRVMAAANAVSAERVPSNTVMIVAPERLAEASAALAFARAETDRRVDEADRQFAGADADRGRRAVSEVRARLAVGRAQVDAAARAPAPRESGRLVRAIETMFSAADAGEQMRDEFGRAVIARTPQISTEIFLGMAASRLREQAGRLGAHVIMMLTADRAEDEAIFARLLETHGRLDALGDVGRIYASAVFPGGPVEQAVKEVDKRFFDDALPFALLTAQSDGRRNTMSVAEFRQSYLPGIKPTERLRDLIVASSRSRFEERRDAAARNVAASGGLTALVCLILLVTAALFRRSLFGPLMRARDQVVAIAQGDLSEPTAVHRMSREIQDMFEGLNVLRAEQIHKLELERDQRRMASELKQLSETDVLTGLLNRRALEATAKRTIAEADARGQSLAVVMFDVDHFKTVNDAHGHAVGDAALRKIADELAPLLRPNDSFARFGGEEFILLLGQVDGPVAMTIAERLRGKLADLVISEELSLSVTGSFGVAVRKPGSELGWEALVALADKRLYAAKKAGRNRVIGRGGPPDAVANGAADAAA